MAFWNGKTIVILIKKPPEQSKEYPEWDVLDCVCCEGIEWGGGECKSCKGGGVVYRHRKSGVIAEYPERFNKGVVT